jgi:thiol-disulfide isomerase/thioredoxin
MHKTLRYLSVLLLFALCLPATADFSVATAGGDRLDIKRFGLDNRGPLFIWLLNQNGETERADSLAATLAEKGASVWQVDLLDSLMRERTAAAIRNLDGDPVASLLDAAVKSGRRPIVLVGFDRMAAPLLKGVHEWQLRTRDEDVGAVAGSVLFFPNLYRGTPVAGEEPEFLDIVAATNMPVLIMQPELGANRARLPALMETLRAAGSSSYSWLVKEVRDYYLLHTEKLRSEGLQARSAQVPDTLERAIRETPDRLLSAARLLAASKKPAKPHPMPDSQVKASAPAYGLIERPRKPAPAFTLTDAHGKSQSLSHGRITLVNFWATWCPPCVQEIPSMNRLAAAYDAKDFGIVSINFKEAPEHVLAFMKQVNVDFPVLIDRDGAVSARWNVFAFPSTFLLDQHGNIRYSVNTAIEWDSDEVKAVIGPLLDEAKAAK